MAPPFASIPPGTAMLRNVVLVCASGFFAIALVLFALEPGSFGLLAVATILLIGTACERWRYARPRPAPPAGAAWQETPERFVDPETGRLVTVWFDPANGERRYVDVGEPPR